MTGEYNPLDYQNLTRNCVEELMRQPLRMLPLEEAFYGAGVYALFYVGTLPFYADVRSDDHPIYVGKAVPPGARTGSAASVRSRALHGRIAEHVRSIEAAENLALGDFQCRYLVVTPLWIVMTERFLIAHYRPLWNVHIDGFGNHPPGSGRPAGEISWWDALHPGREWARLLRQTRTQEDAIARVHEFIRISRTSPAIVARMAEHAIEAEEGGEQIR